MEIIPVSHVREVLKIALVRQPEPMEWDEAAEEAAAAARAAAAGRGPVGQMAHGAPSIGGAPATSEHAQSTGSGSRPRWP